MKHVKCNKCNHEYNIYEIEGDFKLGVGHHILTENCSNCDAIDYTVIEDNIKIKYSDCARDQYFDND